LTFISLKARQRCRHDAGAPADLAPIIVELGAAGKTTLQTIAAGLNERGILTAKGEGEWSAVQVRRILARLGW
jgi:hypothetical protein